MNQKNKFIIMISLIFLVLILTQLNFSQAINSKESKVEEEILEKFNQGEEKIKVIVNLNDKITEKKFFGLMSIQKQVNRENIIEETEIQEKVKHNFVYSNSFSAELTQEEINLLIEKDEVKKIDYDFPIKSFLQNSVNIINASSTWPIQINGENLTGKGQIICVIDTGVNYSHESLGNGWGNKIIAGYNSITSQDCSTNNSACMDDYGHGTHVAGIVAANGSIKGVAPDADLIIIKALNSEGDGSISDLIEGIDWCTSYSENTQKITAISMSLGGGQFSSDCNAYSSTLTNSINNAISKNISVIAATGNTDTEYTNPIAGISSPACVSGVIKVTAVDKSDNYASYAFRHSNFPKIISAPGTTINSTNISGNYVTKSGTSMATPHVAGAIAIINQYFATQEITKTPTEINDLLTNTGKIIYDSLSTKNYTRIDLFSAVDEIPPQIDFSTGTEENNTSFQRNWIFVNTSIIEDNFKNITFNLYNITHHLNSTNYSQKNLSINWTNLNQGIYYYNVTSFDNANNMNYTQTRKIIVDKISPETILISPEDEEITNSFEVNFIGNLSDLNLKNSTLYIWNSTNHLINQTTKEITGQENQTNITVNLSEGGYGNYLWNYYTCDILDNCDFSESNNTLIISKINLILVSPQNNNYTKLEDVDFICNATSYGTNLKNITFNLWNKTTEELINETTISLEGLELSESQQTFQNKLLNDGEYTWGCVVYNQEEDFNSKNYSVSRYNSAPELDITFESITQSSVIIKLNSTREINYSLEDSTNSITNSTFSKTHSITTSGLTPDTTYFFNTTYCDILNNCDTIENNNFTTLEEEPVEPEENPPSSSRSSGTTLAPPILTNPIINYGTIENPINSTQLIKGYTTEIKENNSIYFRNSLNQRHVITLNKKENNSAIFTIQSEPILVQIKLNETKLISINSPYFYDLQIKLLQLSPTIKIDVKEIYFPTNYIETPNTNNSVYLENLINNNEENQNSLKVIIFSIITIIFLIIIILLIKSLISKDEK